MVTMWEVRAADGRLAELLDWVLAHVDPSAQVYRSAAAEPSAASEPGSVDQPSAGDQRVVVIDPTGQAGARLAGLPAEFAARPAHAWDFESVRNV